MEAQPPGRQQGWERPGRALSSVMGPQGRGGLCTPAVTCGLQTAPHISALSPTPPSS